MLLPRDSSPGVAQPYWYLRQYVSGTCCITSRGAEKRAMETAGEYVWEFHCSSTG